MPIWRVTVTKVSAERGKQLPANMQVEVSPKLGTSAKEKAGDTELIRVPYDLNVKYGDMGKIVIGGHMYLIGEDECLRDDGSIKDSDVVRMIYQRIFVEPMVVAIDLAKELKLPLPVRMPQVKVEMGQPADKAKPAKKSKNSAKPKSKK